MDKYSEHNSRALWLLNTALAAGPILLAWLAGTDGLVRVYPPHFLVFHTAVEITAVVVAMMIFVTGYRSMLSSNKGGVATLGVMFLIVGLFDLLHILSYVGMPELITKNIPQKSIFFWLCARTLAGLALLTYVAVPPVRDVSDRHRRRQLGMMLVLFAVVSVIGILRSDRLPALFIIGLGLTALKIGIEWCVILINVVTLLVLWSNLRRGSLAPGQIRLLIYTVAFSIISELCFTMLSSVEKDGANVLGHLYKIAAYLCLFQATVDVSLRFPLHRLQVQHLREQMILSRAPDGILLVNSHGIILFSNPAMEALTGYAPIQLQGQDVAIFLPAHMRASHADLMSRFFTRPRAGLMGVLEAQMLHRNGEVLPVEISLGIFQDDSDKDAIVFVRDLRDRKKFETSLQHQATHDELTDLPNRRMFEHHLELALVRAQRSGKRVAVLFLDLDFFKNINDTYGHHVGDALLVQVGKRVTNALRAGDLLARIGGDEFAVLLCDVEKVDEAEQVAAKIMLQLQVEFVIESHVIHTGASIGISTAPEHAQDSITLLRYADLAMYAAKHRGRAGFMSYVPQMDRLVHDDTKTQAKLRDALLSNSLQLDYLPQFDVITGAIVGVEALLRWSDVELGDVSPAYFIPLAEASGLIVPLSDWVLDTACRQIAAWSNTGTPLVVAVNVSAQQFSRDGFHLRVAEALVRHGANARYLCIEITESTVMSHPERACGVLENLKAMGCSIALDDFGTGHSSLAYLKKLPISKLKIDKSFMDGIPDHKGDTAITRAIIAMAHSLEMNVVAEGVETEEQLDFLRLLACEQFQGWLRARAMCANEVTTRYLIAQEQPDLVRPEDGLAPTR